jgi:hypothetical protein
LKERKPQVTFSCKDEDKTCNFQCMLYHPLTKKLSLTFHLVWVDQVESFYCALDTCSWDMDAHFDRNETNYKCENIQCACIPGRML